MSEQCTGDLLLHLGEDAPRGLHGDVGLECGMCDGGIVRDVPVVRVLQKRVGSRPLRKHARQNATCKHKHEYQLES